MELQKTTLLEKREIANEVLEIRLIKPKNFNFLAGQFIQIHIQKEDKKIFRSYSISSKPTDEYIALCIKLYENGVGSELFRNVHPNEEITFKGPMGRFTHNIQNEDLYFIATGVGLAPIMGIIRDELENKKNHNKIHLLFGVRNEKNIFWIDKLDELQKNYPNFTYTLTISQPEDSWTGLRGRVTEHIKENTSNLHAYLCGSAEMVKDVRKMLTIRGTEVNKIHFEIF